jgi:hypothetical protein
MNGADVDARIKLLVASFDIGASDSVYGLCHTLDQVSRDLALSEELRYPSLSIFPRKHV